MGQNYQKAEYGPQNVAMLNGNGRLCPDSQP
jgi:hypothetical protein